MTYNEFLEEWNNNNEYIIVKTSGSTGLPKEIRLDKDFVAESARRTIDFFKLNSCSRIHSCISPNFIGGKMMAVRAILSGAPLSYEIPSNTPLNSLYPESELFLIAVVPSQMLYILQNKNKLPRIKNILVGGSPIHDELRLKIASGGLNAFETYGMTETASHIALRKISKDIEPFVLLPGIHISLDKESCLKINFDSGQEIQTNDIASIVSEKEFFILGRRDDIIISGAKKINPFELESKISSFIKNKFCISGMPDEKWGESITLFIEGTSFDTEQLRKKMKNVLQSWEIPKAIFFIEKMPMTSNGKIKRPKDLSTLSFVEPDIHPFSSVQNMLKQ